MTSSALSETILDYIDKEASLAVFVLDESGRILKANRYAEKLVGEELAGRPFTEIIVDFTGSLKVPELFHESDPVRLVNVKTFTGLPQTLYFRFRRKESAFVALGEMNGLEVETLRKELIDVNNELSNLGRELHKKNAELLKLNDLKNQFLGMAAHDLRNPVSIISSYSSFLLEEIGADLGKDHAWFLSSIHSSSRFMLGLLDDLLDISMIESGKLRLDKQPTDIAALIERNVNLNRVLADKKKIDLVLRPCKGIPQIDIDRRKIEQVLNNLISNAIKFSPPGATVTVRVLKTGEHITVSVRDQGPGIAEEEKQKLFEAYSKTSAGATDGEKSTGLGLFIVQKIVAGHSGKMWLESEPGKGSNFCFSLPLSGIDLQRKGHKSDRGNSKDTDCR